MSRHSFGSVVFGILATLALTPAGAALAATPQVETFTLVAGAKMAPYGQPTFAPGVKGHHVLLGRGGAIDGQANPMLKIKMGDTVEITLTNLDKAGKPAQLSVPVFHAKTPVLTSGQSATLTFVADRPGIFEYSGKTQFKGKEHHLWAVGLLDIEKD